MPVKIKTDQPFFRDANQVARRVADFWDKISAGWRAIWGPHIHHGYYENDRELTPLEAQENLLHHLTAHLNLTPQSHVLDVGCGMGGSSIYLAKKYGATVTGITLSQQQIKMATQAAQQEKISRVEFKRDDALSLSSIPDNSIDLVWSLESCEQFYNKNLFLQQAYRVLKPGGKLMLATWCSDREEYVNAEARAYKKLCLAFDVPYMPTIEHYRKLLSENFSIDVIHDWSTQVEKSWDIGLSLASAFSFFSLLKMSGLRGVKFVKQLKLMKKAFAEKRVKYGVFFVDKL